MQHVDAGEFTISENQEPDPFKVKAFAKSPNFIRTEDRHRVT